MRGVSEVIAIILILMITIAIAGLAYTFMSSTMASTTSAASSAVTATTSNILTSFRIESFDIAKMFVRNTGQNPISSLSVHVNDEPAIYDITPSTIAPGQIGTVTIYSFIPDGATVKITSPSGFSASKVANPCSKAVGCWKFDEGVGTFASDSSPNGNYGTLLNGPTWASGRYGIGLQFDGLNDYVDVYSGSLQFDGSVTVEAFIYPRAVGGAYIFVHGSTNGLWSTSFVLSSNTMVPEFIINGHKITGSTLAANAWQHFVGVYNGTHKSLYKNGILASVSAETGSIANENGIRIGAEGAGAYLFNGTIDEVRIYNRAVY